MTLLLIQWGNRSHQKSASTVLPSTPTSHLHMCPHTMPFLLVSLHMRPGSHCCCLPKDIPAGILSALIFTTKECIAIGSFLSEYRHYFLHLKHSSPLILCIFSYCSIFIFPLIGKILECVVCIWDLLDSSRSHSTNTAFVKVTNVTHIAKSCDQWSSSSSWPSRGIEHTQLVFFFSEYFFT